MVLGSLMMSLTICHSKCTCQHINFAEWVSRMFCVGRSINSTLGGCRMVGELTFVDVQGFKTIGNTFIVKEFCLSHKDFEFHNIVKSPQLRSELLRTYKRQADWLTFTYHGLKFDSGTLSLTELVQQTLEHVEGVTLVVKGLEKVEWVQQIYENRCEVDCLNVEDLHSSFKFSLKTGNEINSICMYHKRLHPFNQSHCALSNVRELRDFYLSVDCQTCNGEDNFQGD